MSADSLLVHPGPPLSGSLTPPGDKSITHRAYLCALLAEGDSTITGANPGADCAATLAAAGMLGLERRSSADGVRLSGCGMQPREPETVIDCGNSGTTLRLLAGILAAQPFLSVLTGDASLNRRPVARVVEPLRRMGASLWARSGDRLPPLAIRGARLRPLRYELPIPSAQVASCVLLAGLFAEGETSVAIPGPARDHTERLLRALGVVVEERALPGGGRQVAVTGPVRFRGARLRVPGDFSAAAFFLAAAAAIPGARVTATNVNLNPLRTGLLDVLEAMGAGVEREAVRLDSGEEVGAVTVTGPDRLRAFDVPAEWVPRLVDEVPAWVIAATSAAGVSRIRGAQELRVKESDRLSALARNLAALGVEVREHTDGLEITGGPVGGGVIAAEHDHRMAMTFATLGIRARAPIRIDGAATIATSYPDFAETLGSLGGRVEAVVPGARRP